MKVVVLNGSPKGMTSVTMQYLHYFGKLYPQHQLEFLDISLRLSRLERDSELFRETIRQIESADLLIWGTPVYYLLVPSNYKRFIELIHIREAAAAFRGKYTAVLTTSIRFYDHTAHNYLRGICDDLEMKFTGSYSAEMSDLLKPKERQRFRLFAAELVAAVENGEVTSRHYPPLQLEQKEYRPGPSSPQVEIADRKVVMLTDLEEGQENLQRMINRTCDTFGDNIEVINLQELEIRGSCLGCLHCAWDNSCVYEGKDEYIPLFNERIATADILIWAGSIRDRYLSSTWKQFFDRSFFRGHVPALRGRQIGFIISGPLAQLPNLRQLLEAYVELEQANLVGIVTDEAEESLQIDRELDRLAQLAVRYNRNDYFRAPTFLGVGGRLLFRDHIYGKLRFPFRADYREYRKLGLFDFPQKRYRRRLVNNIMLLLGRLPGFRREINRRMKEEMIKPLQQVLQRDDI